MSDQSGSGASASNTASTATVTQPTTPAAATTPTIPAPEFAQATQAAPTAPTTQTNGQTISIPFEVMNKDAAVPTVPAIDFDKLIPESYKSKEFIQNLQKSANPNKVEELLKMYESAQSLIGTKQGIQIPDDKSTPEQVQAYHKAIGVPEDIKGYVYTPPKIEAKDMPLLDHVMSTRPPALMDYFKTECQKAGLTPQQYQHVVQSMDIGFTYANKEAIEADMRGKADVNADFDQRATQMFGTNKNTILNNGASLINHCLPATSPVRVWFQQQPNEVLIGMAAIMEGFRQKFIRPDSFQQPSTAASGISAKDSIIKKGQELMAKRDEMRRTSNGYGPDFERINQEINANFKALENIR